MEEPKIKFHRIGHSNSVFIINGSNSVIVDTGVKKNIKVFKQLFAKYGLQPNDVKLIILTHTHYDHTGNLKILKRFTGAKVLVHKNEFENLKNGDIIIPNGSMFYTRLISRLGKMIHPRFASPKPFLADLVNDNEFDLKDYGINGKVISTPGHSKGSQSVLIGKTLIAGDTFINIFKGVVFPPFVDDSKQILETWQKLFDMGVEEIYPGHGSNFKVQLAFTDFEKWKRKLKV